MSIFNTLSWQNENSLSSYPFEKDLDPQNYIVDAKFVQFDNFIPTLNYTTVDSDRITMSITFDLETIANIEYLRPAYQLNDASKVVRIFSQRNNRFLGSIVFGTGLQELWNLYIGRKLNHNIKFMPSVVRSIPLNDAVYTLDGSYGNVELTRTTGDTTIFYNTVNTLDERKLVFNAVGGHSVSGSKQGLRKINLVTPKDNNITLMSNDVVKVTALNNAFLTIGLVSGEASSSFNIPTLNS